MADTSGKQDERIEKLLDQLADPHTTPVGRANIEKKIEYLKSLRT